MSNRGPELIKKFNENPLAIESEVMLMPEFGGWMVEAVPTKPYDSLIDAGELLSCEEKLLKRRIVLQEFFKQFDLSITSFSNAPTLGTRNHISLGDPELEKLMQENQGNLAKFNEFSQSNFVLD